MAKYLDAQGVQYLIALIKQSPDMQINPPEDEIREKGISISYADSSRLLTYQITRCYWNHKTNTENTSKTAPSTLTASITIPALRDPGQWKFGQADSEGDKYGLVTEDMIEDAARRALEAQGWTKRGEGGGDTPVTPGPGGDHTPLQFSSSLNGTYTYEMNAYYSRALDGSLRTQTIYYKLLEETPGGIESYTVQASSPVQNVQVIKRSDGGWEIRDALDVMSIVATILTDGTGWSYYTGHLSVTFPAVMDNLTVSFTPPSGGDYIPSKLNLITVSL